MPTVQELWKKGEKLEHERNYAEAGALFERSGDVERAISNYKRGGRVDRAAYLMEQGGRGAEAGALLMSVGQYLKAAAIYEKVREYAKAASAYLRAEQRERAAAMYEKADEYEDAAKIYVSLGNFQKAIQLYNEAGNTDKANEVAAKQRGSQPQTAQGKAADQVMQLDPNMEVAAGQYIDAKHVVDAVVGYLRAGRVAEAAKFYGNCQEDIGYNILAAIAGDKQAERKAAEMFLAAKDFQKAGQIFENLEDFVSAGKMYERSDDSYMAAEMYVRAGDSAKAAEMYEKSGNYQQAAEFYLATENFDKAAVNFERSVNNFLAGKLYFRMQKMNKSLQLLQKVQKTEGEYFEACKMIGEILAANGYTDLAIKKYLEVVQSSELSDETAPIYLNLAKTLETKGQQAEALNIYQKIMTWNFDYEDVQARIQALQAGGTRAPGAPKAPAAAGQKPADLPADDVQPLEDEEPQADLSQLLGAHAVTTPDQARGQLVSMMDGFEFLKGTPLFRDLSLDEMKAFYNACETRKFAAKEVMIEQDQPGAALYVLRKGTARVVKVSPTEEDTVARLGPGSPAGEMALVDDAPTSARVVAEGDVEAFVITRDRFEKLLHSNEKTAIKLYRFFISTLSKRLRSTSENLAKAVAASTASARQHG